MHYIVYNGKTFFYCVLLCVCLLKIDKIQNYIFENLKKCLNVYNSVFTYGLNKRKNFFISNFKTKSNTEPLALSVSTMFFK